MTTNDKPHRERKDQIPKNKLEAIFNKTIKSGKCLEWTGNYFNHPTKGKTYPYMYYKNKVWRGNRLVLFLFTGDIPANKHALHTCDNTRCVNPEHLYWGTNIQNVKDMCNRKRSYQQKKTQCRAGHPYRGDNLRIDKDGRRVCKSCKWYRNNKVKVTKENLYA